MFLAPMIGVIEPCILGQVPAAGSPESGLARKCLGPAGSAGALVEATLAALAPPGERIRGYEVGYTLPVPLLKLFKQSGGDWVIDAEAIGRLVRTLRDVDRPAIVYLFSTHFAVNAPIEEALQSDPRNLSVTPAGPLPRDKYYGTDIFNWSFASTSNDITKRRVQAARAVIAEICKLESGQIARIRGVTLLGELHHLFPRFEGGMGFGPPYLVSDYSEASTTGFRDFLRGRYGSIERLNAELQTQWTSFDQINPPSKDIRTTPLRDFTEHIDSFAQGSLPIAGWSHVRGASSTPPLTIRIYRNGDLIGTAPVMLGRRDVLQAVPGLGDANTGWRYDMDFRALPTGLHRIDVFLERGPNDLVHLATRQIAVMDRTQKPPQPMEQKALPASRQPGEEVRGHVDLPADQSSYFYNPLVPLWHAWRGRQVVDYLQYFAKSVKDSCLSGTTLYTHQIVPFTNPGWDQNKYAIDASLQKLESIRLGVSLYGEPTYGTSFMQWFGTSGHSNYGVTEFHPMKAMATPELQQTLDLHAAHGADFVSFFLEPRWDGKLVSRGHNIFS
ncbi:MAG: beta-galactosidase, partial [Ramlibacter sp.]